MPTKAKINKPANHTVFTYFSCNVSKHKMIKNFKIKMDLIDERRKLSELTETALVKNDIEDFDKGNLNIFSRKVLKMLENKENGWEKLLPTGVSEIIKQKELFGYKES